MLSASASPASTTALDTIGSSDLAPAASVQRHVSRIFATQAVPRSDETADDIILSDSAFVRIPTGGDWQVRMRDGEWRGFEGPVIFGAHSRPLPVRVSGDIQVVGFTIRPGAWSALFDIHASRIADMVVPIRTLWPQLHEAVREFDDAIADPQAMRSLVERLVLDRLHRRGFPSVREDMEAFEVVTRESPTLRITDIAAALGEPAARLARHIRHHFGHPPKLVLRRARFLDMAAMLRGIAIHGEEDDVGQRFYDRSHVNREFRLFSGMTPAEFARTPTPLLTLEIEARQRRKAADIVAVAARADIIGRSAPGPIPIPIDLRALPT